MHSGVLATARFGVHTGFMTEPNRSAVETEARAQWRDITAARIALLEPEKTAERIAMAERMLRGGASQSDIMTATRKTYGMAVGGSTLGRLRRKLEKEASYAKRMATRKANAAKAKEPAATASVAEWVRLPAEPGVVDALLAAKVPFIFDGEIVSMKGGVR